MAKECYVYWTNKVNNKIMKALIIGATGATGKDLLNVLLLDTSYAEVVIFVRRPSGVKHPKLVEVIIDFEKQEEVSNQINGEVFFSCLGTTLKVAGSKDQQKHIDYEIPLKFAEIARNNGVSKMILLSAYGASATSKVFYSRIKAALEDRISALSFKQFVIFRPGLLLRNNTDRFGERLTASLLKGLNGIGLFKKFRPMPTLTLAQKMAKAPSLLGAGKNVIELADIFTC